MSSAGTAGAMARMRELLAALAPQQLHIEDDSARHAGHAGSSGGGHYRLILVSAQFSGKNMLARHRMVYNALGNMMQSEIHALALQALAPEETQNI